MPIYFSESEDHRGQSSQAMRLFGRNRPLHSLLGGGRVADILLWRDKTLSAITLAGFTIIWFLFEVVELQFVTLLCYMLLTLMLTIFIWIHAAHLIPWKPPMAHDFQVPPSGVRHVFSKINWLLMKFYWISCGEDLPRFVLVIASLWILAVIGSYSDALNLLYIVYLGLATIPVLYERYEREVDYLAKQGKSDMKTLYNKLDTGVLSKIPRGPVKEKKYR